MQVLVLCSRVVVIINAIISGHYFLHNSIVSSDHENLSYLTIIQARIQEKIWGVGESFLLENANCFYSLFIPSFLASFQLYRL